MTPEDEAALPAFYRGPDIEARIALIAESHARLIGQPLVPPGGDVVMRLWDAPHVIVAHGIQSDPIFFFGNRAALIAFETDAVSFTRMPSRLSAEAPLREERQALLDRVARDGFIDDYAGMRISARGRRFAIPRGVVWNLVDVGGQRHGQAATFIP